MVGKDAAQGFAVNVSVALNSLQFPNVPGATWQFNTKKLGDYLWT